MSGMVSARVPSRSKSTTRWRRGWSRMPVRSPGQSAHLRPRPPTRSARAARSTASRRGARVSPPGRQRTVWRTADSAESSTVRRVSTVRSSSRPAVSARRSSARTSSRKRRSSASASVKRTCEVERASRFGPPCGGCGRAGLLGGRGELGPQPAHRAAHVLAHPGRPVAHRLGDAVLQRRQLAAPLLQLAPAGIGQLVGAAAVDVGAPHQAVLLELGQARVDGARAGPVGAAEPVGEGGDHLVAVHRTLLEQGQQVEPQLAVREDRRHLRPARR